MKQVISKLKQLAEDNTKVADQLADGDRIWSGAEPIPQERVENLIRTYRYWSQCLLMAAWLLEQDVQS